MSDADSFPSLEILGPIGVTATESALAEVRLQAPQGFQLPRSYQRFATAYGYGLLCGLFIVYIPMETPDSLLERNRVLTSVLEDGISSGLFEYEPDGSPDLARRLVPFAISENGHILAWDPEERTGSHEYAIYAIGSKLLAIRRAARTLYDFTEKCLNDSVRSMLGSGYKPLAPTFRPYPVPVSNLKPI